MLQPGEIINNYPVESHRVSQIVIKVLFSELEKPRLCDKHPSSVYKTHDKKLTPAKQTIFLRFEVDCSQLQGESFTNLLFVVSVKSF